MNYIKTIDEIFSQFKGPKFSIIFWYGKEHTYGTGSEIVFTLTIEDEKTAKRLLTQGALGFGESYMEGKIKIEGDIESYLKLRYQIKHVKFSLRIILAIFIAKITSPWNRKQQIAQHYDLGNNFFKLFLDPITMSYSAGYYKTGSEDLAFSQQNKLKLLCDWLDLPPNSYVLDLGSGWGGFSNYAAKNKNWNITGYTLSKEQLKYCTELIKKDNMESLVEFKYGDMMKLPLTKQFDGIIMIESIEHVGERYLQQFFNQLTKIIKPGGSLVLQLTGRYKPRRVDQWTLKYVFPGGYLPTKDELILASKEAGFSTEEFRDGTSDYVKTMSEWIKNLENHKQDIEEKFGESFYRLWELWMHGAKVAFELEKMSLFRIHLKLPKK